MRTSLKRASVFINLLANIYFLPATFFILIDNGGPMGFGYMILLFTIFPNIVFFFAISSVKNKNYDKYLGINLTGNIYLFLIFILAFTLFWK